MLHTTRNFQTQLPTLGSLPIGWLILTLLAPAVVVAATEDDGDGDSADVAIHGHPGSIPALEPILEREESELRILVERYEADRRALSRRYDADWSEARRERMRGFYQGWLDSVGALDTARLGLEGRIDWLLLRTNLQKELARLDLESRQRGEVAALVPFASGILELHELRRRREVPSGRYAAEELERIAKAIEETRQSLERGLEQDATEKDKAEGKKERKRSRRDEKETTEAKNDDEKPALRTNKTLAHRASRISESLNETLADWYEYYDGYDPVFSWWVEQPQAEVSKALEEYHDFLRKEIIGDKEGEDAPIVGDPVGREALLEQLLYEMIAYTPEELVKIAEREFAWCEQEMIRAAREMGYGDDWKAALEAVKSLHVEPGRQPELVRALAEEAIEFFEEGDLLTIPPLAKEVWRMQMMSPERQKMNPFFLGGELITVSYPTDTMSHAEKLMSMRGNNKHFSRAAVHHELIPGHHLQGFMTSRYNSHRRSFATPFWGEGWALYWELRLWDLGFPRSPEDRVGMLFWRMHRCARVIWSLGFHLGDMTPDEAVEFLVDRVGHERENALGEVRRSFEGRYPPLYQLAYLMGGFQFRALNEEIVGSGLMTEREFHNAVLEGGRMPVEMVRARLLGLEVGRDFETEWRFANETDP